MGFETLVFGSKEPKLPQYTDAYTSLLSDPTQLGVFLQNEEVALHFENWASRLTQLFNFAAKAVKKEYIPPGKTAYRTLATEAITGFLLPLLDDDIDDFAVEDDSLAKLTVAILSFAIELASTKDLAALAKSLGEQKDLLEKIVSSESGARVMREFGALDIFKNPKYPSICEGWVHKLVTFVYHCPVGRCHNLKRELDRWRMLMYSNVALVEAKRQHDLANPHTQKPYMPTFEEMRQLKRDEKKCATRTSTRKDPTFEIPSNVAEDLKALKIELPRSPRDVDAIIEQIRVTELPVVLESILQSFPCKPCSDSLMQAKRLATSQYTFGGTENDNEDEDENIPVNEECGLLGGHLGVWKILVSTQGFKDMQKITSDGKSLINYFLKL